MTVEMGSTPYFAGTGGCIFAKFRSATLAISTRWVMKDPPDVVRMLRPIAQEAGTTLTSPSRMVKIPRLQGKDSSVLSG